MAKLLQIAELGHPVLDTRAEGVKDPQSPVIQELADDMLATLDDIGGFGLSAPQVHESLKIFVMTTYPSSSFPNAPRKEPTVVVNPEILQKSEKEVSDWEVVSAFPVFEVVCRGRIPSRCGTRREKEIRLNGSCQAYRHVRSSTNTITSKASCSLTA